MKPTTGSALLTIGLPAFGGRALEEHPIVALENFEQGRMVQADEPRGFPLIAAGVHQRGLTAQRADSVLPQEES